MLKEAIETSLLHFKRAKNNFDEIKADELQLELFEDKEKVKTIDAFIYRFIKLQDFMGEKLFRQLLITLGEYKDNMSLLDVLDKLEKLELIEAADRWIEYRTIRNALTHEYPENEQDIIDGIALALRYFPEIESVLKNIENYVRKNNLLKVNDRNAEPG